MTQKEKLEQLWEAMLQTEKKIINNGNAICSLNHKFIKLQREWGIYESKYIEYLKKRDCFKNFLWWLFCKATFRSTKLTRKELTKRTAKKMARVFYKKGL